MKSYLIGCHWTPKKLRERFRYEFWRYPYFKATLIILGFDLFDIEWGSGTFQCSILGFWFIKYLGD